MPTPRPALPCFLATLLFAFAAQSAFSQPSFIEFESGPVRPVVLTPDGSRLLVTNIPDNALEVFDVSGGSLSHALSIRVGMEPNPARGKGLDRTLAAGVQHVQAAQRFGILATGTRSGAIADPEYGLVTVRGHGRANVGRGLNPGAG